jgi:hypothetical protein
VSLTFPGARQLKNETPDSDHAVALLHQHKLILQQIIFQLKTLWVHQASVA